MKKFFFASLVLIAGCKPKDPYAPSTYYNLHQQDSVKTRIVTYLFEAPPYTSMKDRFEKKHWEFYSTKAALFQLNKLYINKEGKHFFYVLRPAPYPNQNRGVGGYFFVDKNFKLKGFREVFVTPILPEADIKGRCAFLFDEMIKNNIEKYYPMKSYIQWPNVVSYYDTLTYEWKLKPGATISN